MPVWVRGPESAEIVAPFPQKMVVAALGNSGSTGPAGHHRRNRRVRQRRRAARRAGQAVRGKIVFVDHRMAGDPGRHRLWPVRRAAPPGPDRRQPEGRDRRSSSARSAPTITAIRTPASMSFADGAQADPGGRAVDPRCRAAASASSSAAKPVTMQPGAWTASNIGTRPVGQCHRRSAGPRSEPAADPGQRPPRQLGPGHRRDRRRARASPLPPPPPSASWTPGARCAPSASSGSAPRRSACSAGSTIARGTARNRTMR